MKQATTQVARIRYNLEFGGYEAIVFVNDAGERFSYPSFVPAPLDAEYAHVMGRLEKKALERHHSNHPGLRSHMRSAIQTPQQPTPPRLAA